MKNSGTDSVKATVIAVDAGGQPVAGVKVVFAVDAGATVQPSALTTSTDGTGSVFGTIIITSDNLTDRIITLTVTADGANNTKVTKTAQIPVIGTKIQASLVPSVVAPGQSAHVQYTVVDSSLKTMSGVTVVVTRSDGVQVTVPKTDLNGVIDYAYIAPATSFTIRAQIGDTVIDNQTVLVQAAALVDVVTTPVVSASVAPNPAVVNVNATNSTSNLAQIRALFVGANNAPIKNIRVRFDLDGNALSIPGSISSGSTMLYSDSNGVVSTNYLPLDRASPKDGVTVRACWDYKDFPAAAAGVYAADLSANCPNAARATLTVNADPVSISIGSDNLIFIPTSGLTYTVKFVVQVVNSSGLALSGVLITPSLDLIQYRKGFYTLGAQWIQNVTATCDNEDLNRNGIAESWEDVNHSANLLAGQSGLEPRKADVSVTVVGSNLTDLSGKVTLQIEYPQNIGSWDYFNLLVSAGVSGTEFHSNFAEWLPVPGEVIHATDSAPPFIHSPYGVQVSPTVQVINPDQPDPVKPNHQGMLCTNPN
jgi:hypothetical protein